LRVGQDLSIVLVAQKVADQILVKAAKTAFADDPPDNLVLLVATDGPASLTKVMPSLTAVSLWADAEDGLEQFAEELSRTVGRCIVFTIADHACVGGWQIYDKGKPRGSKWVEDDGYTDAAIHGIETAFDLKLQPGKEESAFFAESFMDEPRGLCVFGAAKVLRPGKPVGQKHVQAILEFDLPDAELECLLLAGGG
jgi:hypothetical protein